MSIRSWLGIDRLENKIDQLAQRIWHMDGTVQQLITDFDTETTAVAAKIDALIAANANTISPDQVAQFQAISARLKALGNDPANPIPAPAPAPTPDPSAPTT